MGTQWILAAIKPEIIAIRMHGARPRLPSKRLDQEGVLFEKLRRLKNERSGYLSYC